MKTLSYRWPFWLGVAVLSGVPATHAQFTAHTKLGSGALGLVRTNAAGSYSVIAGGQDIWSAGDEFTFHNFSAQGSFFDLRVRVQSLEANARLTRAGLMVRESLTTNSRMAFARVTPTGLALNGETGANDVRFQYRLGTTPAQGQNEDPASGFPAPSYPNAWVRLERHGNVIGAYSSLDGINWLLLGDQNTATWPAGAFQSAFFLGLAQSRHPLGLKPTNSVEYRSFTAAGNFPPLISNLGNVSTPEDTPTAPLPFTVGDVETAAGALLVTASSSNPTLFPAGSLAVGGSGTNRTVVASPALNVTGIAVITVTASDGVRTASDQFQITVSPVNDPPVMTDVVNQTINEDGTNGPLSFTIGDPDSPLANLSLSAVADNQTLVPDSNIVFGGAGSARTITVRPAPNLSGITRITIRVSDGALIGGDVYTLTVNPVNDPPIISNIPDQVIPANTSTPALGFSIADVETPVASLTLTRNSDNLALVPLAGIVLGTGAARSVTVTPAANQFGSATISVIVSDGTNSTTETFKVTVNPVAPIITQQPQSQTVDEGGRASFGAAASGTPPLSFQWYFNSQPIDGAKESVHVIPVVQRADAGNYTVVVANPAGSATSSPPAVLTVQGLDFGDAPDRPYPTTLAANGARHVIVQGIHLGGRVDGETNGQPDTAALGDDLNPAAVDDEDGVRFLSPFIPGQAAVIEVTASATGRLDAWVDFGIDGSWAETEDRIFSSRILAPGPNTLAVAVPAVAKVGATYVRFRFSALGDLNFVGQASNGEVEDYQVNIEDRPLDFGDAPRIYRTVLADDGARHLIFPGFALGALVDAEPDGQPSADALGDDTPGPAGGADDEDGVTFLQPLIAGTAVRIEVVLSGPPGRLDTWVDFNANGSFSEAGEQIFLNEALATGLNTLTFNVPTAAPQGETFARFRLSRQGGLKPEGLAPDGEVEDYRVDIEDRLLDFGDAPQSYPTLLGQNGARHRSSQLHMGVTLDVESDGQPSATALADDTTPAGSLDDEDGVKFLTPLIPGQGARIEVTVNIPGRLDAWVDFNLNGTWADSGEQIFNSQPLTAGANLLSFTVPATALARETFARFRVSSRGALGFAGFAPDGEVEDYRVGIEQGQLDFGDAPQGYPVTLGNNGARHAIEAGFHLGARVDAESDGQPSADALGDDGPAGAADDEDGVRFLTPLTPGQSAQVEVTASAPGILNTWVDFNINGSWADSGEQVFVDVPLVSGINTLSFGVPSGALPRATYVRFRFSRDGKIGFAGPAPDGEVEDYRVEQGRPRECDQDCTGTNFWLAFPGNYAPDTNNPPRLSLCIVGTAGTSFQVTIPGLGFAVALAIPAGGAALIPLPSAADLGDANDQITKKAVHVLAAAPVSVQGLNHVRYTSDGFLGLSTEALGTEYLIGAFGNLHTGAPDLNGSQFAIAACEDNTRVRITPRIAVGSHPANVSFQIVLQAGETYQLRATDDAPADLTGTLIESDKPVAAFGGHQCANIPSDDQWFCDYIVEQLLPTSRWGRAFVTCPLATRLNGDTFRILARADNTDVSINGGPLIDIDRGEFHQVVLTAGSTIVASEPVSVMQYANSSDFDLVVDSDPFMVIVPPVNMFNRDHVVCTAPVDFTKHYLNVIGPAAVMGALTTNGVVVPAAAFSPIAGSGFVCAQLPVGVGVHRVTAPQPVGVTIYGWGEFDSYGYPGCLALGDGVPPNITCRQTNVTITLLPGSTVNCSAQVPDLRGGVSVSDNCGLSPNSVPRQVPAPGTPVGVGVHPITISVTDANGNTASCVTLLTVIDPGPPTLQCGNLTVRCTTPNGALVPYGMSGRTLCGTIVPAQCTPPSGSFFPLGVTQVSCTASNGGQIATCTFSIKVECNTVGVSINNGALVLTWSDGTLESAPTPAGPWTPVPNAVSPLRLVPAPNSNRFFRVKF